MKKLGLLCVLEVLLVTMLSGCGKSSGPKTLCFPLTSTQTVDGTTRTEQYIVENVIHRKDGLYEIRGKVMDSDGEESTIRMLYTPDGTPIGQRRNDQNGSSDTVLLFDRTVEDHIESLQDVDHVDGNTVYFSQGGYEVIQEESGRYLGSTIYDIAGNEFRITKLNESGFLEYLEFTTTQLTIVATYQEVPVK